MNRGKYLVYWLNDGERKLAQEAPTLEEAKEIGLSIVEQVAAEHDERLAQSVVISPPGKTEWVHFATKINGEWGFVKRFKYNGAESVDRDSLRAL